MQRTNPCVPQSVLSMFKNFVLATSILGSTCVVLSAQDRPASETAPGPSKPNDSIPDAIPLWASGAPGSEKRANEKEKVDEGPGKCNVTNVHSPSITPFLPTRNKRPERLFSSLQAAAIVCCALGMRAIL